MLATAFAPAWSSPAAADTRATQVGEYRAHVARGTKHFKAGRYDEARRAFERAYDIHPAPVLVFNIASTHRRQGSTDQAVTQYRRFVARAKPGDPRVAVARATIRELERAQARDDRADSSPPESLEPVDTLAPADSVTGEGDAAADSPALRTIPPSPTSAANDRHSRGRAMRLAGITVAAGGGTLALLAVWQGTRASNLQRDIETVQVWNLPEEDLYRRGLATERRAIIFGVSSALAVTAGATMYVIGVLRDRRERSLTVAPAADRGSFGAVVRGSF